jgi:branched-chain amino acid transport system permease protein
VSSALSAFARWPHAWVVVFLVLASLPAIVLGNSFLMSICVSIVLFATAVVGLDLLMGYGGLLALGHNGFFALGAYVMGVLAARLGVPLLLGVVLAVVANLGLALLIGAATLRLREYYFAVATLGFGIIVIQLLGGLVDLTGGWSGLRGVPRPEVLGIPLSSDLQFYWLGAACLLASLILARNLVRSRFGRAIRALGNDQLAAESLGIPVARHKIQVFMLASVAASVAGSVYALYLRVITPANFDVTVMMDMVLMLFLGGKATLWGGILGAGVVRLLPEVMGPFENYKTAIQGLIFVLILLFVPRGLAGLLAPLARPRRTEPTRASSRLVDVTQLARADGRVEGPLLRVSQLTRHFQGVRAVTDLAFSVEAGQLKAVIGPNGAGKTTLFNLLTGVLAPDRGQVSFAGRPLIGLRVDQIGSLGVARTFQTPRLFSSLTALDNVLVGCHQQLRGGVASALVPLARTRAEEAAALRQAQALLEFVGIHERSDVLADNLPFGERRVLEIARALASRPRLLLLDEPAAGLNDAEKERLGDLLVQLREAGLTILLVEHDMRLVMRIADEVLVMDHGEKIAEGPPTVVQRDRDVIRAYLGTEPAYATP